MTCTSSILIYPVSLTVDAFISSLPLRSLPLLITSLLYTVTLPSHADNDDEADAEVQDEVEDMYGAKYLPPLVRQPLPIGPSVTSIGVRTYRNMQGECVVLHSTAHVVDWTLLSESK
jgi:hypothetical protein